MPRKEGGVAEEVESGVLPAVQHLYRGVRPHANVEDHSVDRVGLDLELTRPREGAPPELNSGERRDLDPAILGMGASGESDGEKTTECEILGPFRGLH